MAKMAFLLAVIATPLACAGEEKPGFYVEGRYLYSPCGEKVMLCGVNAITLAAADNGAAAFSEIARTGANACRIYWKADTNISLESFEQTIINCIANNMIPMPELHDATGDWSKLQLCVDWWTKPEVVEIIRDYEKYVLVNIANEVGRWEVTDEQFKDSYEAAVKQIRKTGIRCPLVIDAAGWGRGENYLLNNARCLIDADPQHNLIFSWHPWDPANYRERPGSKKRINTAIDKSIELDICFILGEFSRCELPFNCDRAPLLWQYMIEYATKNEIGWLPWSWYCCGEKPDVHSITSDGIFGHWYNEPWGRQVAVDGEYSIKNVAIRPGFVTEGGCPGKPALAVKGNTLN